MRKMIKKIPCLLAAIVLLVGFVSPMNVNAASAALDEQTVAILSYLAPRVMVESYEVVDGQMLQGEEFTLKVNLKNTNEYADAYNVLVTYTSETDNVRLVDQATNQHYEPLIKAGETVSYEMVMEVMDIYEMDTMIMDFNFHYYDQLGNGYDNLSKVTPRIGKSCEMEINSLTVSETATVGAKSLVNLRYSSVGKSPIESATMIIKGDISENEKEIPLAGVSGSEQKYLDYYVNFLNPGEQTLTIEFKYTDEEGREYTIEPQEFDVTVSSYQPKVTVVSEADINTISTIDYEIYLLVGCIGVIVAVALVVLISVIKRKVEK